MMARKLDLLAAALFVLGLLALVFLVGFFSGKNRGFLYDPLKQAEESARGIWNAYFDKLDFIITDRGPEPAQTTARALDPARMAPGVTLLGAYTQDGFAAWLVDAQGKELHRWHARFSEVFPAPSHILWQARDQAVSWHGMHLFPNGDLLFNFQDANFPFGSGLVKLDKDSKVVWKLAANTHHDVMVEPDGTIWVPAHHYRPQGLPGFPHLQPWYYEDVVLEVAPDGTVRDEFPVLGALKDNQGLLTVTYSQGLNVDQSDPTHLNSVMPLPAAWADRFPGLAAGDLLVSLRNLNMLAVLDRQTKKLKRVINGPFVRQHDAEFLPNGHIMVYDNSGGDPACGGTRVLELDPANLQPVWQYDGCRDGGLNSFVRGMQQVLDNGNVLLAEPLGGRALEVTHDPEPKLVWEYVNVIGNESGKPVRGLINHAERFPREALTFLPPG
ncbi:MAG: arylsulfotransferase family protein [Geminicoccaceae bacterium]